VPLRGLIAPLLLLAALPATAQQATDPPIRVDGYADIAHLDLQGCIGNSSHTSCTGTDGVTYVFPTPIISPNSAPDTAIKAGGWHGLGPVTPGN